MNMVKKIKIRRLVLEKMQKIRVLLAVTALYNDDMCFQYILTDCKALTSLVS